jgi:hypothetical protein
VLQCSVVLDLLTHRDRTPIKFCAHRNGFGDERPSVIYIPRRFAGCASCVNGRYEAERAVLDYDNSCDLCGADHGVLHPVVLQHGPLLVSAWFGPCCNELVNYLAPVASFTVGLVGRNDPCPCSSGRKFKKCCGGAA